ncbi:uncharacterized protein LOC128857621 [Anastrepha ludens]|uniref:uncharacterized protein LOC128857621 n=1 Tax=Anastrepha ludens TaxID=28586 RepID=UPI0023B0E6C2|nr:uncharacterized protein LOC128857621 [Anastrepha ludens]
MNDAFNRELEREREYDLHELIQSVQRNVPLLNPKQREVYDTLINAIDDGNGGLFFLDAPGGTRKTFLMSLILATVRARSEIAVAIVSPGIAATLLDGCRTAHSASKLPLNLQTTDHPTCNISKHSAMAKVLVGSKIIIWDECTMAHKRALEALDRTLKDLRNDSRCVGGAMILLFGDFRQTQINAYLKASNLWRYVKKLQLSVNMRVALLNDLSADDFSKQLLTIGNGRVPVDESSGLISFPPNFCNFVSSKDELINKVFPDIIANHKNTKWLSERAILAAKNKDVDDLNFIIQNQILDGESNRTIEEILNEDSDSESVLGGHLEEQISDIDGISDCEEPSTQDSDSSEDLGPEIEACSSKSEDEPVAGPSQSSYYGKNKYKWSKNPPAAT